MSEVESAERALWASVYAAMISSLMADPARGGSIDRSNAAASSATQAVQQMRLDFGEGGALA